MKKDPSPRKRANKTLLAVVAMVPGFCSPEESDSSKSWKMYSFISSRIGKSCDREFSFQLKKSLGTKRFTSVADFDEYICKLNANGI